MNLEIGEEKREKEKKRQQKNPTNHQDGGEKKDKIAKFPVRKRDETPGLLLYLRCLMIYTSCNYFIVVSMGCSTLR